jgi:dTMP kinase
MIIALEGVSSTGKSTLAARLAARLGWTVIPCYYHVADDPAALGEPLVDTEQQQLAALDVHLEIEERRCRLAGSAAARDGGVLLDRSVDTLLAHVRAAGRLRGLDTEDEARRRVEERIARGQAVRPDLTLLLTADVGELVRRAASRPGLHHVFRDPAYVEQFNAHFDRPLSPRWLTLDSIVAPDALLAAALAHIGAETLRTPTGGHCPSAEHQPPRGDR